MKLINPSCELLVQGPGVPGIYEQIEIAGRTCYKSEDKIAQGTAEKFVQTMIKSDHTAMLEHGTVYLRITHSTPLHDPEYLGSVDTINFYKQNKYSEVVEKSTTGSYYTVAYITTNLRVLVENGRLHDLRYLCEPEEEHKKRITLRFQGNIHFYKDATRHRTHSFAIESTRWINYMREKYGMSITFMKPVWIRSEDLDEFKEDCSTIEKIYAKWIDKGYRAEQAAYFLCQGVAASVVITAFASDWKHFFDLRYFGTTGKPHPDMVAITEKAKVVLEENNLWNLIYTERE